MKIVPSSLEHSYPSMQFVTTVLCTILLLGRPVASLSRDLHGISSKLWHELGRGIGNENLNE